MSSSMTSAVVMTMIVILLLVVVAEGHRRKGGSIRMHHHFDMDGCGRNHTCSKLSYKCNKLLFVSMVDSHAGAGDREIMTTVDKMAAMMEMFEEQKKNLTDCANETGIQLPNSDGGNKFTGGGRFGRKWQVDNFGVSEEDAKELRKCLLNKKGMLNPDGTLNRESLKAQISPTFSSQAGLQTAVMEAVDACPEPQDYNVDYFISCIKKVCINNLILGDEDDNGGFPGGIKQRIFVTPTPKKIKKRSFGIPGVLRQQFILGCKREFILGCERD